MPKTAASTRCAATATTAPAASSSPRRCSTKPPSAELRPDQRDDQSLPPYEVLDPILEAYVEDDLTAGELEAAGFDPDLVRRVVGSSTGPSTSAGSTRRECA